MIMTKNEITLRAFTHLAQALGITPPRAHELDRISLEINDEISFSFVVDGPMDRILIYSQIYDMRGSTEKDRTSILTELLTAELTFADRQIGRIGLSPETSSILYYHSIPLTESGPQELVSCFPKIIRMVQAWKTIFKSIQNQNDLTIPLGESYVRP